MDSPATCRGTEFHSASAAAHPEPGSKRLRSVDDSFGHKQRLRVANATSTSPGDRWKQIEIAIDNRKIWKVIFTALHCVSAQEPLVTEARTYWPRMGLLPWSPKGPTTYVVPLCADTYSLRVAAASLLQCQPRPLLLYFRVKRARESERGGGVCKCQILQTSAGLGLTHGVCT